jgi:ribose 5-phosphate isomerase RpiB
MKIICACDSYGSSLLDALVEHLQCKPDLEVDNRGVFHKYYEAAHQVAGEIEAAQLAKDTSVRGLLCCGSGMVGAGTPACQP